MVETVDDIVSMFSLDSCVKCGTCDKVCPSGRNGGIRPDFLIYSIVDAPSSSRLSELQADIWRCLMCHRCSMSCPEKIDVTGVIRTLRHHSAQSGGIPKRFRRAKDTLTEVGRAFPMDGLVNRKREDLGLKRIEEDADSLNELKIIMKRTGFCDE